MSKKKHTKKKVILPCGDANQHLRERADEKKRVEAARLKKLEEYRAKVEEERRKQRLANLDTTTHFDKKDNKDSSETV